MERGQFKLNCWTNSGFPHHSVGESEQSGASDESSLMLHLSLKNPENVWGRNEWRMRFHNDFITIKKQFRFMFTISAWQTKIKSFNLMIMCENQEKERRECHCSIVAVACISLYCALKACARNVFLATICRTRKLYFYDQQRSQKKNIILLINL